ncbi:MAG: hypothetical protein RLY97_1120 [Pseudomonadota bacterium]
MSLLILDASATVSFILADEANQQIPEVAEALLEGRCIVPAIWSWEIANILWKCVKSGRVTQVECESILANLADFSIAIDAVSLSAALGQTLSLATQHQLTSYDAAYLESAIRLGASLASFDKNLRAAALSMGITVFPKP